MQTAECPTDAELAAFHRGGDVATDVAGRVAAHVRGCARCESALAALAAAPRDDAAGGAAQLIAGKYKLVEPIGVGGMGVVHLARQTEPVRRLVALKLVKPGMDTDGVLARFEAERQALALMDHPNIAKILDAGSTEAGRPFFVMELVKGVPITKYCDENRLTPRERLALFVPVCQAVQHAHQKGIIHRDIKPSNVLVACYDGRPVPKVIDFGIAKATGQALTRQTLMTGLGAVVGTPEYMAPEQAELNQLDVDTRADVYALGVLLYELLTGTTPLTRDRLREAAVLEVLRLVREEEPPAPSTRLSTADGLPSIAANRGSEPKRLTAQVRGELDWIVLKCLEKDRARRYETANDLARDVERFLGDEIVEARPPSAAYRLRKVARRYRGPLRAAAAAAAMLAVATGVSAWMAVRASAAEAATACALDATREEAANREAVLKFVLDKVFAAGRPKGHPGGLGKDVTLRQAVDAAAPAIAGAFRDRPLVEAAVRNVVGTSYHYLGEPAASVAQYEPAYRLYAAAFGPNHADTLSALDDLATAEREAGRVPEAIAHHEDALARRRAVLGPGHRDVLLSMNNLGAAYMAAGRLADAAKVLGEALPLRQAALGADDADTLETQSNLAEAHRLAGRVAEALALQEDALAKRRAKLGPDHPDTLRSVMNLGGTYWFAGRPDDALRQFEACVPRQRAVLGADHPDTLTCTSNLAAGYYSAGRIPEATRLLEETLPVQRAKLGPTHGDTLITMSNLASMYLAAGRHADAVPLCEVVVPALRASVGADHPNARASVSTLAAAYLGTGRAAEAKPLRDAYLAGQRSFLGANDPRFAAELARQALSLVKYNQFADAEPLLRECLAIREAKEPEAWGTFNVKALLGAALAGLGKPAEGEPHLLAGYAGLKAREAALPPPAKTRLPEVTEQLAQLYDTLGKPDEAAKWKAERARYATPPAAPAQ